MCDSEPLLGHQQEHLFVVPSTPLLPPMPSTVVTSGGTAEPPNAASAASAMLAKRERRLRLEKVGSYRVGRTLGRGNFAQVRIAYHEIANAKVAMKIVDKRSLDAENLAKIEREIQILQQVHHPFIVKLFEVIRTERHLYIVTEYVSNGELFDMLMDRGRQTETESRRLFQQIVSAVAYCHANGIVHRDLKAENLLLDKKGNIKIIDFGFSNYQPQDQLLSTWCGSPPYAAPELLLAQEYDGRQSDVWSLGVILYILVTAGFPFPGDSVEKLKRAVLGDHLKIPFWVSVECADLIRKMLTISPVKRYTLQQVIQHRWMSGGQMPDQIKQLLANLATTTAVIKAEQQNSPIANGRPPLDPTVLVFMQQHTGWSDDQITEEVLSRNYESPIFATYELLLCRLSEFRDAEAAALVSNSGGPIAAVGGNLHLENEQTRRGSRGSIISGRANLEPAEVATFAVTIPAHHLAKLSLSTSPDYESDDSDSASDLLDTNEDVSPPRFPQQPQPNTYKSRHRAYRRGRAEQHQQQLEQQQQAQQAARLPYALEYQQLNPLLNAAAQQFAVDTTRAWANAAAAAALFASQLQQQSSGSGAAAGGVQQQLQQAAALNLVSLQNFPFVDYARMMHVPNQERRASANEALLGLNSYAHLLAACSTMGMGGGGNGATATGADTRCSSSQGTSSSPRQPPQQQHHRSSYHQQPRRSVEEEGEFYLSQRGSSKRNTVHSITGGMALLAGPSGSIGGGASAGGAAASTFQSAQSAFQRHSRTPYFKQSTASISGGITASGERRSSWASSSAGAASTALAINAQQQAQLERLYRQSISQAAAAAAANDTAPLSGVQQLQLEFQKLCASTKDSSPGPSTRSTNTLGASPSASLLLDPTALSASTNQQQQQQQMPTINITDENNRNVGSAFVPAVAEQQPPQPPQQIISILAGTIQPADPNGTSPFSQSLPQQRPATVCGFSAAPGNNPSSPSSPSAEGPSAQPQVKFVYIPVSLQTALERLQRFVQAHQLLCEVQCDEPNASIQNVNAVRIRVAPASNEAAASCSTTTILELALFRMDQSPNISRASFSHIQGDSSEFEQLRTGLLSVFNEVL